MEQEKANLVVEVENLRGEVNNKDMKYEKIEEDIRTKLQQLRVFYIFFSFLLASHYILHIAGLAEGNST